ncbi:hypothetical protein Snoj_21750 [Streptomyces nojiriensis]|uniref:Uncharacterized protein n=1 Tax=Streptomyces nojiriensis TaxID=66374 RepID=A0ABQ3SJS3_9ACTN|nr:hypothetical protein [Streptomyces nojiriensis]QTI49864.1 hypothetical protein JYK04_07737 [Streptomyces nojiriensis]GGS20869.1 hypothetical protein GCM10010205_58530 [Streptomyces nojiriensis]GHI68257.1 hypothetical protein Snoj_21750 [Streptomyces nojiriensis]
MLEEALAALAVASGTAVVQAAGTDAWNGFQVRVARLFGRGDAHRERAELERLGRTAELLAAAGMEEPEQVRIRQEVSWQTRFETLLESLTAEEREQVAAELRSLLAEKTEHGRRVGGVVSGNTFHGPTAIQVGDRNRQDNHFGPGA